MKRKNYRGKRRGLDGDQVIAVAVFVMAALLLLTMTVNARQTGKSVGAQLYEAVFITRDWE